MALIALAFVRCSQCIVARIASIIASSELYSSSALALPKTTAGSNFLNFSSRIASISSVPLSLSELSVLAESEVSEVSLSVLVLSELSGVSLSESELSEVPKTNSSKLSAVISSSECGTLSISSSSKISSSLSFSSGGKSSKSCEFKML